MEVYTPNFIKIRNLIQDKIINYIGESYVVNSKKINEFVLKIKEQNKNDPDFELIDFTYSSAYSPQVEELLFELIRRCIVEEVRNGYRLTSYGYRLIGNDI